MRSFLIVAVAILAFGATMTARAPEANAVVCANGVVRAGCASLPPAVGWWSTASRSVDASDVTNLR